MKAILFAGVQTPHLVLVIGFDTKSRDTGKVLHRSAV
jgi:hypothetical protein